MGGGGDLQTDAAQLFLLDPIPANLSIYIFSLIKGTMHSFYLQSWQNPQLKRIPVSKNVFNKVPFNINFKVQLFLIRTQMTKGILTQYLKAQSSHFSISSSILFVMSLHIRVYDGINGSSSPTRSELKSSLEGSATALDNSKKLFACLVFSDADPDPDPPDPHVFGPPGSGSGTIRKRYGSGSGSGSFYHQAKKVRKNLIPTALWLLFDFYLWKWCTCTFKK